MATASRADPTRSITLRKNYQAALYKRFRRIKGMVREAVVEKDVLGLGRNAPGIRLQQEVDLREFQFATRQDKIEPFMQWLEEAEEDELLDRVQGPRMSPFDDKHFSNKYVRRAYGKGVRQADIDLKKQGLADPTDEVASTDDFGRIFNQPIHQSKLEMLYTRNFRGLKGITDSMDTEISRVLSEGVAQGINPLDMASQINGEIDIGINRARTLARTEVIHTHAEATLNRYEQKQVQRVAGKVEWLTAGDRRVCHICEGLEEETFSLENARGLIPAHPNCRCRWIPVA